MSILQEPQTKIVVVELPSSSSVTLQDLEQVLVETELVNTVTVDKQDVVVVENSTSTYVQGGTQGPPGTPGSSEQHVFISSAIALGGNRAVTTNSSGLLIYPDMNTTNNILGITTGSYLPGEFVEVQITGVMTEPSWNWDVNTPVYVGNSGLLTQTEPLVGNLCVIGYPLSPTKLFIDKQPAIIRT